MNDHDDACDPWLTRALRHAPDADVEPSPALGATILRQARARAAAPHRLRRWLGAWWAWLARPAVASGLAALTLSTVIGVGWWSGALDDAQPEPQPPRPRSAEALPGAAPAARGRTPNDTASPPAAAERRKEIEPTPKEQPRRGAAKGMPASKLHTPAQTDIESQRDAAAARSETAPAPAKSEAPPAPAPQSTTGMLGGFAASRADPLAALSAPLRDQPGAFEWRSGAASHAHAERQRAWFEHLRAATAGRWQRTTRPPSGPALQLYEGTTLRASVVLGADGVYWADAQLGSWFAPLDRERAAELRARVASW